MIPLRFCWDVANIRRWDVSWVLINQILILIIPYGDSCRKWAFRCPPLGWAVESSWVLTSSDKFWHSTPFTGALGAWEQGLESRLVTADGRSAIRTRSLGLYIYYTVYINMIYCNITINSHHLPRFWKSSTGSLSSLSSTSASASSSSSSSIAIPYGILLLGDKPTKLWQYIVGRLCFNGNMNPKYWWDIPWYISLGIQTGQWKILIFVENLPSERHLHG